MKWYASINLAGGLMLAALCAAQAAGTYRSTHRTR